MYAYGGGLVPRQMRNYEAPSISLPNLRKATYMQLKITVLMRITGGACRTGACTCVAPSACVCACTWVCGCLPLYIATDGSDVYLYEFSRDRQVRACMWLHRLLVHVCAIACADDAFVDFMCGCVCPPVYIATQRSHMYLYLS